MKYGIGVPKLSRRTWPAVAALLIISALPRVAAATCDEVVALMQRGASAVQISKLTGLTGDQIRACTAQKPFVADPAGPPPIGAAGPPPVGAAGPAPHGAAGPAPLGAAGPAPFGAAGPPPHGAAGASPFGTQR